MLEAKWRVARSADRAEIQLENKGKTDLKVRGEDNNYMLYQGKVRLAGISRKMDSSLHEREWGVVVYEDIGLILVRLPGNWKATRS